MELPGTVNERIGDLRTNMELSQKELAEMIDISASQLSRIESGETQSISSETLIKLAKALHVSSDYILGLTAISDPKSYDISELGLSEGAVKALTLGKVDVQILNRLLEHKSFPSLLFMIKACFSQQYKQVGNALPVNLAYEIAVKIKERLECLNVDDTIHNRTGIR